MDRLSVIVQIMKCMQLSVLIFHICFRLLQFLKAYIWGQWPWDSHLPAGSLSLEKQAPCLDVPLSHLEKLQMYFPRELKEKSHGDLILARNLNSWKYILNVKNKNTETNDFIEEFWDSDFLIGVAHDEWSVLLWTWIS